MNHWNAVTLAVPLAFGTGLVIGALLAVWAFSSTMKHIRRRGDWS